LIQCKKEKKKLKYAEDVAALRSVPCEESGNWRRILYVKRKGSIEVRQIHADVIELIGEFPVKLLKGD
jgi:hypothetical protein